MKFTSITLKSWLAFCACIALFICTPVWAKRPNIVVMLADDWGFSDVGAFGGEIQRVARVAFELARKRNNKVTSCEKSNVMEAGLLWREVVEELHKKEFKDVELSHMLADNCAMQLVRNPKQFDVIVTDNLFGDMLSDVLSRATRCLTFLGILFEGGRLKTFFIKVEAGAGSIAASSLNC